MRNFLLGLSLLLVFSTAQALSEPTDQPADSQQIQLHLKNLDSAKTQHETEIQQIKQQLQNQQNQATISQQVTDKRFEMQDARVGDLGIATGQQANTIALLGIFITFIALVAGFGAYFTATNRAIQEAKKHAEIAAEKWFDTHKIKLGNDLRNVENLASQTSNRIKEMHDLIASKVQELKLPAGTQNKIDDIEKTADLTNTRNVDLAGSKLHHYYDIASEHLSNERYEEAIVNYEKAISESRNLDNLDDLLILELFYNKAFALNRINKVKEAIDEYDNIINIFDKNSDKESMYDITSKSMLNKGALLNKLGELSKSTEIYKRLINLFKNDKSLGIKLQVLMAQYNAASNYHLSKMNDEAIDLFDNIITNNSSELDEKIRIQVAKALSAKAAILIQSNETDKALNATKEYELIFGFDGNSKSPNSDAIAIFTKSIGFSFKDKFNESINLIEILIEKFKNSSDESIQTLLKSASIFRKSIDELISKKSKE